VSLRGRKEQRVGGQPIDPRDVAAGTAIGAAARIGAARYRDRIRGQRTGEGAAAGAGAATAVDRAKARRRKGSLLPVTIAFLIILIGMLALMLAVGR
jgi:hypothetical protein